MNDHPQPSQNLSAPGAEPTPVPPSPDKSGRSRVLTFIIAGLIVIIAVLALLLVLDRNAAAPTKDDASIDEKSTSEKPDTKEEPVAKVEGLQLDEKKNYGNKYSNGLLPVGDSKYSTTAASKGNIYLCHANFVPASQAGAQRRGPWFTNNNTQYDINKKSKIAGSVNWTQKFSVSVQNGKRNILTNDLPNHPTGVYPVAASDPARTYDANPSTISEQNLLYQLTAEPEYGTPQCMDGDVGVMLTGVALNNGFDAGGRDAGAWEVQDKCDGHPQNKGMYHYHTLSGCITDTSVHTVIGWALDGFPITGPKVGDGNILTTDDLDECHGLTSSYTLDNKTVTGYHYVMTQDFPYSASCFRATAIQPPGRDEH